MPYRAMFTTIVTVALMLAAVGMWIHLVSPMMVESAAATQRVEAPATGASAHHSLEMVVKGTLLLSFVLICLLLLVGFFATFREWVRFRTSDKGVKRGKKTRYVDAWKLAGERIKVEGEEGEKEGE